MRTIQCNALVPICLVMMHSHTSGREKAIGLFHHLALLHVALEKPWGNNVHVLSLIYSGGLRLFGHCYFQMVRAVVFKNVIGRSSFSDQFQN